MLTSLQLRLIHMAYRQAGLEEEHYRLILQNVAGVASAKQLTQAGFEDVMAVLEDSGFQERGQPANYWRARVAQRGVLCGARMAHKIAELAAGQAYDLAGLCRRVRGRRVGIVERLSPREGYELIELLKAVAKRREVPAGEAGTAAAPAMDVQTAH
jgi:hypothetical protein